MICQSCGVAATTRYVSFHQNIGALVVRFSRSMEGNLCKNCVHRHFWSMSGITFFLGWWGTISLIITPFLLLNNVCRYLGCLTMPAVPPEAEAPSLSEEDIDELQPHVPELFERLNNGEDLQTVVTSIADRTGLLPGQIILYVQAMLQQQERG